MMTPEPGSFFEDEVLTLTGKIRGCHFYRCHIVLKGPVDIRDCTFGEMKFGDIEGVGKEIVVKDCLVIPPRADT